LGIAISEGSAVARYDLDWMTDVAAGLSDLAADIGKHPATVAVAWAAHHRAVTSPIMSADAFLDNYEGDD